MAAAVMNAMANTSYSSHWKSSLSKHICTKRLQTTTKSTHSLSSERNRIISSSREGSSALTAWEQLSSAVYQRGEPVVSSGADHMSLCMTVAESHASGDENSHLSSGIMSGYKDSEAHDWGQSPPVDSVDSAWPQAPDRWCIFKVGD